MTVTAEAVGNANATGTQTHWPWHDFSAMPGAQPLHGIWHGVSPVIALVCFDGAAAVHAANAAAAGANASATVSATLMTHLAMAEVYRIGCQPITP